MKLCSKTRPSYKLIALAVFLALCLIGILGYVSFLKKHSSAKIINLNDPKIETTSQDSMPIISVVVEVIGSLKPELISSIPNEITLGIPSYMLDQAYNNPLLQKHNVALNIQLEPNYYNKPTIQNSLLSEGELVRIHKDLNYQTVYTYNPITQYEQIEDLLKYFKEKNIIYLSGLNNKNDLIYDIAKKINFDILQNNIIIDEIISSEKIMERLLELENIAKQCGSAIAIGNSYPLTIETLRKWKTTLEDKNIRLVTIQEFDRITKKDRDQLLETEYKNIK